MDNKQKDLTRCSQDRVSVFVESIITEGSGLLRELEREALDRDVPIIRPRTRGLLQLLLTIHRPARILEVGTALGYSALAMRETAIQEGFACSITTIERDAARAQEARRNLDRAGAGEGECTISLIEGNAAQILEELEGTFDFIFLDAAKGQYIHFLPALKRLLAAGGVMVSDNVLRGGDILNSHYLVTRRNRTIHKRMREYLRALMEDPALRTVILEMEDGAAVSVKRAFVQEQDI